MHALILKAQRTYYESRKTKPWPSLGSCWLRCSLQVCVMCHDVMMDMGYGFISAQASVGHFASISPYYVMVALMYASL